METVHITIYMFCCVMLLVGLASTSVCWPYSVVGLAIATYVFVVMFLVGLAIAT